MWECGQKVRLPTPRSFQKLTSTFWTISSRHWHNKYKMMTRSRSLHCVLVDSLTQVRVRQQVNWTVHGPSFFFFLDKVHMLKMKKLCDWKATAKIKNHYLNMTLNIRTSCKMAKHSIRNKGVRAQGKEHLQKYLRVSSICSYVSPRATSGGSKGVCSQSSLS